MCSATYQNRDTNILTLSQMYDREKANFLSIFVPEYLVVTGICVTHTPQALY